LNNVHSNWLRDEGGEIESGIRAAALQNLAKMLAHNTARQRLGVRQPYAAFLLRLPALQLGRIATKRFRSSRTFGMLLSAPGKGYHRFGSVCFRVEIGLIAFWAGGTGI
jgi:hypothetical protein